MAGSGYLQDPSETIEDPAAGASCPRSKLIGTRPLEQNEERLLDLSPDQFKSSLALLSNELHATLKSLQGCNLTPPNPNLDKAEYKPGSVSIFTTEQTDTGQKENLSPQLRRASPRKKKATIRELTPPLPVTVDPIKLEASLEDHLDTAGRASSTPPAILVAEPCAISSESHLEDVEIFPRALNPHGLFLSSSANPNLLDQGEFDQTTTTRATSKQHSSNQVTHRTQTNSRVSSTDQSSFQQLWLMAGPKRSHSPAVAESSSKQPRLESPEPSNMTVSPNGDELQAPVLATRTTEAVIADLKGIALTTAANSSKRNPSQVSHQSDVSSHSIDLPGLSFDGQQSLNDPDANDASLDQVESEDEPEAVSKPRKITERKRKQNAVADSFMDAYNLKIVREANKVRPEDESQQSTRWLIHQSENRKIISTPREYQVELFNRARERNIIAVLDTGSGKTLIAVLLLRHILAGELEDRAMGKRRRISFFLVDSVQLVFQQHAVLKTNLDYPMNMFYGAQGCDLWSKALWQRHFSDNMVIVCTAEVLRQCLHHSFISMDQINLLIFDEAHHAKKDHPYARIIKDFYTQQRDGTPLPKIFGMTASPIDARVDVRKAAAELEGLLHCEIATAEDASLLKYADNTETRTEEVARYSTLGPRFETPLYKEIYSRFKSNPILSKPLLWSYEASRELGAWCSDRLWQSCMSDQEVMKLLAKTERQYHAKRVQAPLAVLENGKALIIEAKNIVKAHNFEPPDFEEGSNVSSNLSSKVLLLISYLRRRFERPTQDKCIVFVQRRYTALILAELFSHTAIKTRYLSVGSLIGTSVGNAGDMNVSFHEQTLTMRDFRTGKVNCLFATAVAEEGLDIPECNLIVRFDLYATLIQYIQSRGRARQANSKYIHMCEDRNEEQLQMIKEVRKNENILKEFCKALPENRKLMGNSFDMDYFLSKEKRNRVLVISSTGAKLNYKMSLTVLANFVDKLPHNQEINVQPEYIMTVLNKEFICEAILPENSPIRGAVGRPASTKQVAKCSAAFETCVKLISGNYLDENLLPIFTKKLPVMRNALLAVDSKKREAYDMRVKPKMWSIGGIPEKLYVTILRLGNHGAIGRPSQPLAMLTRSILPELPSFFLHFGDNKNSSVQCITLFQPLWVSPAMIKQMDIFTRLLFDDVFSKLYESNISKMPYFLVPVDSAATFQSTSNASTIIDWKVLEGIEEWQSKWGENYWDNKSWQTESDEALSDKFIVDPYDGSRKLWSVRRAKEYKPLDPVPANMAPRKGTRKNNDNIMEYSCSLWTKARARRTFDPDQRVFEAEYISLRRNLLDEFEKPEEATPKKCFIILEPLKISPLPTTVAAMAYVFPAIIYRVESYMIALEACEMLRLDIRPDLALEAVTKDSDNTDEHDAEQINFQRGMGNNYERLEFLGDCFLKMATSISLFGIKPDSDEYEYHVERMLLICNKNLKNVAVKLKLYEFIRSTGFSRRAWYPEGLVLLKGKTQAAPDSHKLGDKTIADVSEALIGAALLSHHESKNMDWAVRAVSELVSAENHKIAAFSDYYKLYQKPKYQTAPATEEQKHVAASVERDDPYHFNYPRLLQSAFTHPSYPYSWGHLPSYQRLEFLGDSLLDMVCVNYLYHNFPDKNPQWLTEHKMAMVSNQFLGALCVNLGFHRHLRLFNSTFQKQITDYETDIIEARNQAEKDAVRIGKRPEDCTPDYWTSVSQPPKCLPDIVEAYIGAIFVDSEFNYSEVERFFEAHIKWYFKDISIYDTYANKHPTTFLTNFLQINMGCMDWTLTTREIPSIDGSKPVVVAMLVLHGKVAAHTQAESSRYAKVNAAKQAVKKLEGLGLPEFRKQYCCDCKLEDLQEVEEMEQLHGTAI